MARGALRILSENSFSQAAAKQVRAAHCGDEADTPPQSNPTARDALRILAGKSRELKKRMDPNLQWNYAGPRSKIISHHSAGYKRARWNAPEEEDDGSKGEDGMFLVRPKTKSKMFDRPLGSDPHRPARGPAGASKIRKVCGSKVNEANIMAGCGGGSMDVEL